MKRLVSIGECMVEFGRTAGSDLWTRSFAGDTFNTAWYFRYLCPTWKTAYVSAVGEDRASADMVGFIADAGVDTTLIQRIPDRNPGLYTIELENGERSFTYWRKDAAARLLARDGEWLAAALNGADEIYFSGITLAILSVDDRHRLLQCIKSAYDGGSSVSFDPNIRPKLWSGPMEIKHWIKAAAMVSSRVFPTYPDEAAIFDDRSLDATADRYRGYGVAEVIVKNGEQPCLAHLGGAGEFIEAEQVTKPVDTTGAGDSFNGAYLAARQYGVASGDSCRFAHKLASKVVMSHGALLPPEEFADLSPGDRS